MHWKFDRIARFEHVVERHLLMLKYLRADRLDTPRDARERIDWRIAYVETRLAHFRMVARASRWNAKRAEMANA